MHGLIAVRTVVLAALTGIDADIRQLVRAFAACRRLTTIPGVSAEAAT
jgi:hypothetical protein